jgi:hypothetical protein
MGYVSEIIRFLLPKAKLNTNAFRDLRQRVRTNGLVSTQYFGYVLQNEGSATPKPADQVCWYIGRLLSYIFLT